MEVWWKSTPLVVAAFLIRRQSSELPPKHRLPSSTMSCVRTKPLQWTLPYPSRLRRWSAKIRAHGPNASFRLELNKMLSTIIVIQNGIGNEEEFQARFPNNTVLSGVVLTCYYWCVYVAHLQQTWVGATQVQPGTIIVCGHSGSYLSHDGLVDAGLA